MGRVRVVLIVTIAAFALLGAACVPPPADPRPWLEPPVMDASTPNRQFDHEVVVLDESAVVDLGVASGVFGLVEVCAVLGDRSNHHYRNPRSRSCETVVSVLGTEQVITLPIVSPTGEYPYEGVLEFKTSVRPGFEYGLGYTLARFVSTEGIEFGCQGRRWDFGSILCYED